MGGELEEPQAGWWPVQHVFSLHNNSDGFFLIASLHVRRTPLVSIIRLPLGRLLQGTNTEVLCISYSHIPHNHKTRRTVYLTSKGLDLNSYRGIAGVRMYICSTRIAWTNAVLYTNDRQVPEQGNANALGTDNLASQLPKVYLIQPREGFSLSQVYM